MLKPSPNQNQITLDQTSEVVCESCKNDIFTVAFKLRSASPIVTGLPKPHPFPIEVFACNKCGTVCDMFLPEQLKKPSLLAK